ncbi:MAG: sugar transferase [Verrucomicrobiota bacterium]
MSLSSLPSPRNKFIHRSVDRLIAGAILFISGPLIVMTAMALSLAHGKWPFKKRLSFRPDGRAFHLLYFRRGRTTSLVFKWMDRLCLTGLPALWNVIKGDLRLVGPRPAFAEESPQTQAGFTGWAETFSRR